MRWCILEQIAHGTGFDSAEDIRISVIVGNHEDLGRGGHRGANLRGCLRATHNAGPFHARAEAQVHQYDIDAARLRCRHRSFGRSDLPYDVDILCALKHGAQTQADDFVVICQ